MKILKYFLFTIPFIFAGCATDLTQIDVVTAARTISLLSTASEQEDTIVQNTENQVIDLSASSVIQYFKVNADVGTLTINNASNKEVYVVSQNNTNKTIKTANALSISKVLSAGRAAFDDESIGQESDLLPDEEEIKKINGFSSVSIKSVKVSDVKFNDDSNSRAAVSYQDSYDIGKAVTVGSTKSIYIDSNEDLTEFRKATAKAEYIGKYCIIWSVTDQKVPDTDTIKNLAAAFDEYYPTERQVFGCESDKLYINDGSGFILDDISKHNNSGNKVNIVIYNITDPYVVGYFHSKDYFETADELFVTIGKQYTNQNCYSNGGKYFYLNYRYAAGSASNKKLAESTLVHEFQHMINYSVKNMNGLVSEDWYNEMLSMLAEDMFTDIIGTGTSAPANMRMSTFQTGYYKSGLTQFDTYFSYGTSYAFGAWLVRNFGGTDLIHLMMTNGKVNADSVVNAVNTLSAKVYTFDTLFNEYVKECINSEGFSNQVANDISGTNYVFNSIKKSPVVNAVSSTTGSDIGPYGFVLRKITVTDNSFTLSLSQRTNRETVYVIVK